MTETTYFRQNIEMRSYKGHASFASYDTFKGFFARSASDSHLFQLGVHTIQDKQHRVVMDEEQKILILAHRSPETDPMDNLQLNALTELVEKAYIRLIPGGKQVQLKYPRGSEYEIIEFSIDNDHWLREMVLYFAYALTEHPDDPPSTAKKPKVVMDFSKPQIGRTAVNNIEFRTGAYIKWEKKKPSAIDKRFEFLDSRVTYN